MQTSTIRRLPDRVAGPSLKMALSKPPAVPADGRVLSSERPLKAVKLPYGGYRGAELWPDGELRINDPELYTEADRELLAVLEALATLNRTGLYSAFYEYAAHVGVLDIRIYEGRWNHLKKPVVEVSLDCRRVPLRDMDTDELVTVEAFMNRLILMLQ